MNERLPLLLLVPTLAACAGSLSPPGDVIDRAARALGGRDAIQTTRTVVAEGRGEHFILAQGRAPTSGFITYRIDRIRRAIDLAAHRWRDESLLTPRFPTGNPEPRTHVIALDGDVGFDIDGETATRTSEVDARDRRTELLHSPLGILRAALPPGAVIANHRDLGDRDAVDVQTTTGERATLVVDRASGLPVQVTSQIDHPNLGDTTLTTEFADYRPAGPLRLPRRVNQTLEGVRLSSLRVDRYTLNTNLDDLAAPASVRSTPPPADPPVQVDVLAPGVWRLHGGHHHSVLVELADHLVLIEAPWTEARTLAVLARARQLQPAKPLTQVVVTHHHHDHSVGLRAAVSQGLTVIVDDRLRPFIESMVERPHTIAPDALARQPRPLALETVRGHKTLGDTGRRVQLFSIDTAHAEAMLIAYLPAERILVEADLYTVPAPDWPAPRSYPFAGALVDLVEREGLAVDRVVPLHQTMATYADLVAAARQTARR